MDNERKVKNLVPKAGNAFLDWKNLEIGSRDLYDLEKEFSLTRKNKNYIVMIAILLFLITVAGTAYAVTRYIQEAGKIVPVQITDFEDVNLKEILDVAKNYEFRLNNARSSLEQIRTAYTETIDQIRGKYARNVSIIRESSESDQVKNRRISAAANVRDNEITAVRAEYEVQIAQLEQEIQEIETAMASYDATVLEQARKQEEILNNQKVMADLQMQETIDNYEKRIELLASRYEAETSSLKNDNERLVRVLRQRYSAELKSMYDKYDPVYNSAAILSILADKKEVELPVYAGDYAVRTLMENKAVSADEIRLIRKEAEDSVLLVERLSEIPFENSNAEALKRLLEKSAFIKNGYERIWSRSAAVLDEKNRILDSFSSAFDYFTRESGVSGYIVDAADPLKIFIYMNKIITINNGDSAYVFRGDDEPVGEIEFYYAGESLFARELVLSDRFPIENKKIMPFDRILVIIQ